MLALLAAAVPAQGQQAPDNPPAPITAAGRLEWTVVSTIGLKSLGAGVVSAGWGTWRGTPHEYESNWEGFAKRYGMRLTGVSTGNAIEAALGAAWGEDPRYRRSGRGSLMNRVGHAAKLTVIAPRASGAMAPSYARYAGIVGNNFLSNAWRVESDSGVDDAWRRTAFGFSGKFVSNLFEEFWPDVRTRMRRGGVKPDAEAVPAPAP